MEEIYASSQVLELQNKGAKRAATTGVRGGLGFAAGSFTAYCFQGPCHDSLGFNVRQIVMHFLWLFASLTMSVVLEKSSKGSR